MAVLAKRLKYVALMFLVTQHSCASFACAPTVRITVSPVDASTTHELADLRYNEWIEGKYPDSSRAGFREATSEICQERAAGGATAFLASLHEDDKEPVVVGTAELSPIELEGTGTTGMLYVTDVMTARQHRRKGVALRLMEAIEKAAMEQACQQLLLHVESSNTAALEFYQTKLGYCNTSLLHPDFLANLDIERLAVNAGTTGQTLLGKTLHYVQQSKNQIQRVPSGRGFGGVNAKTKRKRPQ